MPWNPSEKWRHSKKARGKKASRQAAHVANSMMERGYSEGAAIRAANGVIKKRAAKRKKARSRARS